MRFLVDAMFPPQVVERLNAAGHDAVTPAELGAANLPDEALIQVATAVLGARVDDAGEG